MEVIFYEDKGIFIFNSCNVYDDNTVFGSESKAAMTSWSAEQPPEGAKGVEKGQNIGFVINPHKHLTVHH